jgi:heme exporter protein B
MVKPYLALISREVKLLAGRGSESLSTLAFFIIVVSLFPFALAVHQGALQQAAPGILWVAALLAALLSLETVHYRDFEDGTLDLLLMSPLSQTGIAFAKMAAHWLLSGFLLVLAVFPAGVMLGLPPEKLWLAALSLLPGTLYMSLLGGAGAALTLGSRRSGLLLAVLILPLYAPMLVLGMLAVEAALADLPCRAYLLLQSALVVAALPVAPFAAAAFFNMHLRSR